MCPVRARGNTSSLLSLYFLTFHSIFQYFYFLLFFFLTRFIYFLAFPPLPVLPEYSHYISRPDVAGGD